MIDQRAYVTLDLTRPDSSLEDAVAIRLNRSVLTQNGTVNVEAWHLAVATGISVGRCDCGSPTSGERIPSGHLAFATAVCVGCGREAVRPVIRARMTPRSVVRRPAAA